MSYDRFQPIGENNPFPMATGTEYNPFEPVSGCNPFPVQITQAANPAPLGLDIMPVNSTALWTTDKTAALTVAVDSTVLFHDQPTLKITIPATTSGVCKVGTSGANALIPYGWDRENFALAVRYSGFTGYDYASTFPPALLAFFGDATYANFWQVNQFNLANFPETKPRADEWFIGKATSTWTTGGGSPAVASKMRCKLQWTQVSQETDCTIHVGFFGKMPERAKATVIWTLDDGYASWDSFIEPLFKHHNMPVTMGIAQNFIGGAGYLTAAQVAALYNDSSRLFDIVNHAQNNDGHTSLGDAAYYAQVVACRDYLRSIGIDGDGPLHHPYVQSQWDNDVVDLLSAGGFLTARAGTLTAAQHGKDQLMHTGQDKLRWYMNAAIFLGSAKSFNDAKTVVDAAVTAKSAIIIGGHDFAATADTYVWTYDDMNQLAAYVSGLMRAGNLEVKSWSKWYADLTGRATTRR